MKNEQLNIDNYFNIARSAPIVISKEEVLKIIGNVPCAPYISFKHTILKFKNIIIMTTSVITTIITAFIFFGTPTDIITNNNDPIIDENKVIIANSLDEFNEPEKNKNEKNKTYNEAIIELTENNKNDILNDTVIELNNNDDSIKSMLNRNKTGFIIPIASKSKISTKDPVFKEVFSRSASDDTIKDKKNVITKHFNNEFDYKEGSTINISNRYGDINIKSWDKNKIHVKATVSVKSPDKNSIEEFFNNFELTPEYQNEDLYIKQPIVSQNHTGILFVQINRTKFKNGKKIKRIFRFSVDYEITVPKQCNLKVENKYNDIYLGDIDGILSVDLYEADLKAGNIQGFFDLTLKYGNAEVKSINNSTIDIYESNIGIGTANVVKLKSKYSELKFNKINALDLDSYEDELYVESDMTKFKGKLLYGNAHFKNINDCDINLYETDITGGVFEKFKYEGKYAGIEILGTDSMEIFNSYEDNFKIHEAGAIFGKGKYVEFEIRKLTKSMIFNNYGGFVDIHSVGSGPLELGFKSKYTDYTVVLNSKKSYKFDTNCEYVEFDFPKENFEANLFISDDDKLKIEGVLNSKSEKNGSKIKFECYEGDINISLR
jgi:hypothetical protein